MGFRKNLFEAQWPETIKSEVKKRENDFCPDKTPIFGIGPIRPIPGAGLLGVSIWKFDVRPRALDLVPLNSRNRCSQYLSVWPCFFFWENLPSSNEITRTVSKNSTASDETASEIFLWTIHGIYICTWSLYRRQALYIFLWLGIGFNLVGGDYWNVKILVSEIWSTTDIRAWLLGLLIDSQLFAPMGSEVAVIMYL